MAADLLTIINPVNSQIRLKVSARDLIDGADHITSIPLCEFGDIVPTGLNDFLQVLSTIQTDERLFKAGHVFIEHRGKMDTDLVEHAWQLISTPPFFIPKAMQKWSMKITDTITVTKLNIKK